MSRKPDPVVRVADQLVAVLDLAWMPKYSEGQYSRQGHWFRDVWRAHG